ncbi:MAG: TlpA family protein disulfide reductase [Akkermansiaceae bacterium]|nr:TlpA family protein disulfide reductase [Akkermansiaceae bacterium]
MAPGWLFNRNDDKMKNYFCTLMMGLSCAVAQSTAVVEAAPGTTEVSADADLPSVPASLQGRQYITKAKPNTEAKVYFIYQSRYMCPTCVAEAPAIVAAYKKMKGKGAELVMLNVDADDETAAKWARKAKMRFPIVSPTDRSGIPFPHTGSSKLPCMVALDAHGNKLGEASGAEVAEFLSSNWKQYVKDIKKAEAAQKKSKQKD